MLIYIFGTITKDYNNIDEEHAQKLRKRVMVDIDRAELIRLRTAWGHTRLPAVDNEARILVNIYGRKNMQPYLDRRCRFGLKISRPTPQYDRKRLILKSIDVL
jgi:hypothetical protein